MDVFSDTFYKSNFSFFRNFIINPFCYKNVDELLNNIEHDGFPSVKPRVDIPSVYYTTKWIIASDYVFNDDKKAQNTISFAIIPDYNYYFFLQKDIRNNQAKDIKKSSDISTGFVNILNGYPIMTISISIDKEVRLFFDEKIYFIEKINNYIRMIELQKENSCKNIDKYEEKIKLLNRYKSAIESKNPNLSILRQIEFISSFIGFLMFEITKLIPNINQITWISDRDPTLFYKNNEFKNPMIFDYAEMTYLALCDSCLCKNKAALYFYLPSERDKNLLYDELIRIPDYFAGTLATVVANDNKNISPPHDKFTKMLAQLFTKKERHLFFRIKTKFYEENDKMINGIVECVRLYFYCPNSNEVKEN